MKHFTFHFFKGLFIIFLLFISIYLGYLSYKEQTFLIFILFFNFLNKYNENFKKEILIEFYLSISSIVFLLSLLTTTFFSYVKFNFMF